jgi:hypothetical protein
MKDCKHRIFRRYCCVCWWKYAKGIFNHSSNNIINDPDDGSWVGR